MTTDKINTGIKFFGQKIFIESSGDKKVDKALKTAFKDGYWRASMYGVPVQVILEWQKARWQSVMKDKIICCEKEKCSLLEV